MLAFAVENDVSWMKMEYRRAVTEAAGCGQEAARSMENSVRRPGRKEGERPDEVDEHPRDSQAGGGGEVDVKVIGSVAVNPQGQQWRAESVEAAEVGGAEGIHRHDESRERERSGVEDRGE